MLFRSNTDIPIVIESNNASLANMTKINYKPFYQGMIYSTIDNQNDSPYLDLNTALVNAFTIDNYVLLILDGYVMALIRHIDNRIYVFDSHARNEYGMPDDNGTAVVMKCCDITALDQYLSTLAGCLNSQFFEIMPVTFSINNITQSLINSNQRNLQREKCLHTAQMYNKKKIIEETPLERETRLEKMRAYRKKRKLTESPLEKQNRLDVNNKRKKKRISEETQSQRQARLNALKVYNKKRISAETESERQTRLNSYKVYNKKRISAETDSERQTRLHAKKFTTRREFLKKLNVGRKLD